MKIFISILAVLITLNAKAWYITGTANVVVVNNSGVSRTWTFTGKKQSDGSLPVTVNQYIADGATVTVTINNLSVATGDGSNPDGTSPNTYWPLVFANDTCGYNFQAYTFPYYTTVPTFNLTLLPSCAYSNSVPPCTKEVAVTYQNNDSVPHGVNFVFASGLIKGPYIAQPTEVLNAKFYVDCSDSYVGARIVPAVGLVTDTSSHTNQINDSSTTTNGVPVTNIVTGTITPPPLTTGTNISSGGSTYNPTNSYSQIIWSPSATTNSSLAIQQGSSAIYDAITKGTALAHQDSTVLHGDLTGIGLTLSNINTKTGGNGSNVISVNFTNYATEGTQSNLYKWNTNFWGSALTNSTATNPAAMYQNAAAATANSGSNQLSGLASGLSANPVTANERYGDESAVVWIVDVPYLSVGSIDINPMHNNNIATIAAFMRAALKWGLLVSLVGVNFSALMAALNALGATRQASASGQAILGVNANLVTALAMAALITVVMLAVPAFAVTQFTQYASTLAQNPFSGVGGIMAASVWLADQFFPLAVIVACPIAFYTFRASMSAIVWGVQTATRFLVG